MPLDPNPIGSMPVHWQVGPCIGIRYTHTGHCSQQIQFINCNAQESESRSGTSLREPHTKAHVHHPDRSSLISVNPHLLAALSLTRAPHAKRHVRVASCHHVPVTCPRYDVLRCCCDHSLDTRARCVVCPADPRIAGTAEVCRQIIVWRCLPRRCALALG